MFAMSTSKEHTSYIQFDLLKTFILSYPALDPDLQLHKTQP